MAKTHLGQQQELRMWERSTKSPWPNMSLGLIRGSAAISFENELRNYLVLPMLLLNHEHMHLSANDLGI